MITRGGIGRNSRYLPVKEVGVEAAKPEGQLPKQYAMSRPSGVADKIV